LPPARAHWVGRGFDDAQVKQPHEQSEQAIQKFDDALMFSRRGHVDIHIPVHPFG
jgi:hypothetical protein